MKQDERISWHDSGDFRSEWLRFLEASARLHAAGLRTGVLRPFARPAVEVIAALQESRRIEEVVSAWSRFRTVKGIDPAPAMLQLEVGSFTEAVDHAMKPLDEEVAPSLKRSKRAAMRKVLDAGTIVVGSLNSVLGPFLGPGVKALLSVLEEIGQIATANQK